jgi:hypoxanthine phosphoribosyltransferase
MATTASRTWTLRTATLNRSFPSDGIEGRALFNAYTIAYVGCLIPLHPFDSNLILTLSTYTFALAAVLNHLFPRRLSFLTHVVKALYTWLLFSSIHAPLYIPAAISIFDLMPLATNTYRLSAVTEWIGAAARLAAVFIGLWMVNFDPFLLAIYLPCSLVYFRERKRRIRNNVRHAYAWSHGLEHVAVVAFLFTVNYSRLNHRAVYLSAISYTLCLAFPLAIAGVAINRSLKVHLASKAPLWLDKEVAPWLRDKVRSNARSAKLYNYIVKPFAPTIVNTYITWSNIESMIDSIEIKERIDVVAGVLSGGAFIAGYVARRCAAEEVVYVQSRLWSAMSLSKNMKEAARLYLGLPLSAKLFLVGDARSVAGKTVLVVDDSTCSGTTMTQVNAYLRSLGAKRVIEFALTCNSRHKTDYYYRLSGTPLIWPWGWESD